MENLDKALFFAIKKGDIPLAKQFVQKAANVHAIFQQQKNQWISTLNLFIRNFSKLACTKGPLVHAYRQSLQLFKLIIPKANLQCKCLNEHKCPLFYALQTFKITSEEEILNNKSDILKILIINGASIKFEQNQNKKSQKKIGKWSLRWLDLVGIRAYLITKRFSLVETQN